MPVLLSDRLVLSLQYTLEQALLSASQEIEMNADNPVAIQSVVLQRDELQGGLLSTCREVSRATAVGVTQIIDCCIAP